MNFMLKTDKGFSIPVTVEISKRNGNAVHYNSINNLYKTFYKRLHLEDEFGNFYTIDNALVEDFGFCKQISTNDYENDFADHVDGINEFISELKEGIDFTYEEVNF